MKKTVLLIASLASLAAAALAQPAYMNYQGRLLDAGGQPLTNGACKLEFNIYDSPTDTNIVWGPFLCDDGGGDGHAARAVVANGRFNVILGANDTEGRALTGAFLGDTRFVEIKVNDGAPILPRQQVLSAPYAIQSTSARTAQVASNLVQQVADTLCPPGTIVAFGGVTVPAGWLSCNGSSLPTTGNYARLFAAIGYSWGGSGGNFNLPDLRGMFLRGVNGSRTGAYADPDATGRAAGPNGGNAANQVGSHQSDGIQTHVHKWGYYSSSDLYSWDSTGGAVKALDRLTSNQIPSGYSSLADDYMDVMNVSGGFWTAQDAPSVIPGTETRPKNAYVNYIIKY